MAFYENHSYKNFPFVKILPGLVAGIYLQWHLHFYINQMLISFAATVVLFIATSFLPSAKKYFYGWINGLQLFMLLVCTGVLLTWFANIRNHENWFGKS
ncbi:MAG: hypothetical protein EBZ58_09770 [Bacteroidetes bacterium]|nr:hypothetical protein [Bacteroidota bacterium]